MGIPIKKEPVESVQQTNKKYNVAVIGSRTFYEPMIVKYALDNFRKNSEIDFIVSGGAKGADSLGEAYADKYGIKKKIFLPEWKKYGKSAGFVRNKDIIDNCDVVFAFWDFESNGTRNSINYAKRSNKTIFIYDFLKKEWSKDFKLLKRKNLLNNIKNEKSFNDSSHC